MTLHTLITEMGSDHELLVRSDAWLRNQRKLVASQMDSLSNELRHINTALEIKNRLKQTNHVAVQRLIMGDDGEVNDIEISITDLPSAITMLADPCTTLESANAQAQMMAWKGDDFDVETSTEIAKSRR